MDGYARTLVKTISWRAIATFTTMAIVYVYTREMVLSFGVGAIEVVSKMALYYLHERMWQRLPWGKSNTEKAWEREVIPETSTINTRNAQDAVDMATPLLGNNDAS